MFAPWFLRCGILLPFMSPVVNPPPASNWGTSADTGAVADRSHGASDPAASSIPGPVADEITQLHRALQMSPLAGSALERPPVSTSSDTSRPHASANAAFEQAVRSLSPARADESLPDMLPQRPPAGEDDASLPVFLRMISRELDQLANDLEDRRQYTTADEIRGLSQQLRQRTRRID